MLRCSYKQHLLKIPKGNQQCLYIVLQSHSCTELATYNTLTASHKKISTKPYYPVIILAYIYQYQA